MSNEKELEQMTLDDNQTAVSELNKLIEICKDGERGFQLAAVAVKDGALRRLFADYSHRHAWLIEELKEHVRRIQELTKEHRR